MAQHSWQLKHPRALDKAWTWPREVPAGVVFDPLSTVSATYGVASKTQFRGGQGPWSSQPAIFVIDQGGVIRHARSRRNKDIREDEFFPVLDGLDAQRRLIVALRETGQAALGPLGPRSKVAIPALARAL